MTRVIEDYDLSLGTDAHESVSDYLLDRWQSEDLGYRAIATIINERLVRRASVQAGRQVTNPQVESEYATLAEGDTDEAAEVRAALEMAGVDVESLEDAFLSHMAIRRHFRGCLGVETPTTESSGNWQEEGIAFLRDQYHDRVDDICRSLAHNDIVPDADDASTQVSVDLRCPECPTRTPIDTAIEQGYVCEDHSGGEPE